MKMTVKYTLLILTVLLMVCQTPLYAASQKRGAHADTRAEDQLETAFDSGDDPTEFDRQTEAGSAGDEDFNF